MGFLSRVRDTISNVADAVKDKVQEAVLTVAVAIDDMKYKFSDIFGNSKSYEDTMPDKIDTEKVLAEFRENLQEKACTLEESKIEGVTTAFDTFISKIKRVYPEIVATLQTKKENIIKKVSGTIMNDISKSVSENDEGFKAVLEMQPGREKTKKMKAQMDKCLENAEKKFDQKLKKQMKKLNDEVEIRLKDELAQKERTLQEETFIYEDLERQSADGEINAEHFLDDLEFATEIKLCLEQVLGGVN